MVSASRPRMAVPRQFANIRETPNPGELQMKLVPIKVAGRELEPHKAVVDPLIGSSTVPANRQHELQIGDGFVTLMALGVPSVFRLVLPSARSGRDSPHNARAPSTASFAPEHIVTPMDGDMRAHTFVWNHPPYKRDTGGDEFPHTWKAIVFLSLSRIRSFLDTSADRSSGLFICGWW